MLQGMKAGIEKGLRKGRQEGRNEGRNEGQLAATKRIDRAMLEEGLEPDQVAKLTGLSLRQRAKLQYYPLKRFRQTAAALGLPFVFTGFSVRLSAPRPRPRRSRDGLD